MFQFGTCPHCARNGATIREIIKTKKLTNGICERCEKIESAVSSATAIPQNKISDSHRIRIQRKMEEEALLQIIGQDKRADLQAASEILGWTQKKTYRVQRRLGRKKANLPLPKIHQIRSALAGEGKPMTISELMAATNSSRSTIFRAIKKAPDIIEIEKTKKLKYFALRN